MRKPTTVLAILGSTGILAVGGAVAASGDATCTATVNGQTTQSSGTSGCSQSVSTNSSNGSSTLTNDLSNAGVPQTDVNALIEKYLGQTQGQGGDDSSLDSSDDVGSLTEDLSSAGANQQDISGLIDQFISEAQSGDEVAAPDASQAGGSEPSESSSAGSTSSNGSSSCSTSGDITVEQTNGGSANCSASSTSR